jgi:hypothetical protein
MMGVPEMDTDMTIPKETAKLPVKWRIAAAKCESVAKANIFCDDTWLWTEGCGETYKRCADELDEILNGFKVSGTLDV